MGAMLRRGCVFLVLVMLILVEQSLSRLKAPPPPQCRVTLINMAQVLKGYAKVARFQKENQNLLEPLRFKVKEIEAAFKADEKLCDCRPLECGQLAERERRLTEYKRKLEEASSEAKRLLTAKSEEQARIVNNDVAAAARTYAKQHDVDLILPYNGLPVDSPDYYSPVNVSQKMKTVGPMPMYIRKGLDITNEIVNLLNDAYRLEPIPHTKDKP